MTYLLFFGTGVLVGLIAGLLIYRNNSSKAEKVIGEVQAAEAKVKSFVKK